ncbi:MAG: DNA/RNA nuclease SfsA [Candidatus Absconditabacteria bacterium]
MFILKVSNLLYGKFVIRHNRFVGEGMFEGKTIQFHIADSGRLTELLREGNEVCIYKKQFPGKYEYALLLVKNTVGIRALINSFFHPGLIKNYLKENNISFKSEVVYGDSRLDFLIENSIYVETKGCSLVVEEVGMFPDAPTIRGAKHLMELIHIMETGGNSQLWFVLTSKIKAFVPNQGTDKNFSRLFYEYVNMGGKVRFFDVTYVFGTDFVEFGIEEDNSVKILVDNS